VKLQTNPLNQLYMSEESYSDEYIPAEYGGILRISRDPIRGLSTLKDLKPGEVIFVESPIAVSLRGDYATQQSHTSPSTHGSRASRCSLCFRPSSKLKTCTGCKSARYCSVSCQRYAWHFMRHSLLCPVMRRYRDASSEDPDKNPLMLSKFMLPIPLLLTLNERRLVSGCGGADICKPGHVQTTPFRWLSATKAFIAQDGCVQCPPNVVAHMEQQYSDLPTEVAEGIVHFAVGARNLCAQVLKDQIEAHLASPPPAECENTMSSGSSQPTSELDEPGVEQKQQPKGDDEAPINLNARSSVSSHILHDLVDDLSVLSEQTEGDALMTASYSGSKIPSLEKDSDNEEDNDDVEEDASTKKDLIRQAAPMEHLRCIDMRQVYGLYAACVKNVISITTPTDEELGQGMYPLFAMMNHSCTPNVTVQFVYAEGAPPQMVVRALTNIPKGSPLLFCYRPLPDAGKCFRSRRDTLLQEYGFVCQCHACHHGWTPTVHHRLLLTREAEGGPIASPKVKQIPVIGLDTPETIVAENIAERGIVCPIGCGGVLVPTFAHEDAPVEGTDAMGNGDTSPKFEIILPLYACTVCALTVPISMSLSGQQQSEDVLLPSFQHVQHKLSFPSIAASNERGIAVFSSELRRRWLATCQGGVHGFLSKLRVALAASDPALVKGYKVMMQVQFIRRLQLYAENTLRLALDRFQREDAGLSPQIPTVQIPPTPIARVKLEFGKPGDDDNWKASPLKGMPIQQVLNTLFSPKYLARTASDLKCKLAFDILLFALAAYDGYIRPSDLETMAANASVQRLALLASQGQGKAQIDPDSITKFWLTADEVDAFPILIPPVVDVEQLTTHAYLSLFEDQFLPDMSDKARIPESIRKKVAWLDNRACSPHCNIEGAVLTYEDYLDHLAIKEALSRHQLVREAGQSWTQAQLQSLSEPTGGTEESERRRPLVHALHVWRQELFHPLQLWATSPANQGANTSDLVPSGGTGMLAPSPSSLQRRMSFALLCELALRRIAACVPKCLRDALPWDRRLPCTLQGYTTAVAIRGDIARLRPLEVECEMKLDATTKRTDQRADPQFYGILHQCLDAARELQLYDVAHELASLASAQVNVLFPSWVKYGSHLPDALHENLGLRDQFTAKPVSTDSGGVQVGELTYSGLRELVLLAKTEAQQQLHLRTILSKQSP